MQLVHELSMSKNYKQVLIRCRYLHTTFNLIKASTSVSNNRLKQTGIKTKANEGEMSILSDSPAKAT